MTTILILLLCYVVAASIFVRWVKTHAPDGYESEEQGFVMTVRPPVKDAEATAPAAAATSVRPVWSGRATGDAPLQTTYHAGQA